MALLIALLLPAAFAQATGTLTGTLYLDGVNNPITPAHPINFEFTPAGGGNSVFVKTVSVDSGSHTYTLSVPAGTYDIGVSVPLWLRVVMKNVTIQDNLPTTQDVTLAGGDTDNNGMVDVLDFGNLVNVYGTDVSDSNSGYDSTCDFNWDGRVDVLDFGILVNSYGAGGSGGSGGVLYPINLTATPSAGNVVTLHWNAPANSGNLAPAYTIYRSATPTHSTAVYAVTSATTLTETLPASGAYYYQVVATIPMLNGNTSYGLSNEAVISPNPLIENFGNRVFRITGFQSDRTTVNYQALATNGLLNSFVVYDATGHNGSEFFHQNGAVNNVPFQYVSGTIYLGNDSFDLFTPPANVPLDSVSGTYHHLNSAPVVNGSQIAVSLTETYQVNGAYPTSAITYNASPTDLFVTLDAHNLGYVDTAWLIGCGLDANYNNNEHVLAVQSKNEAAKNYSVRLHGDGITHRLPLVTGPYRPDTEGLTGIFNMRYFLDNGTALDVQNVNSFGLGNDVSKNYYGSLFSSQFVAPYSLPSTAWGRRHFTGLDAIQFAFNTVPNPTPAYRVNSSVAPPFRIAVMPSSSDPLGQNYLTPAFAGQGMIAATTDGVHANSLPLRILFDRRQQANWPGAFFFNYEVKDFWGKTVYTTAGNTNARIEVDKSSLLKYQQDYAQYYSTGANYYYYDYPLDLSFGTGTAPTGWFQIRVWLDQGDANQTTPYIPDEDIAQYSVYTYQTAPPNPGSGQQPSKPYLYNTPAATIGQALAMRSMRESGDIARDANGVARPYPYTTLQPNKNYAPAGMTAAQLADWEAGFESQYRHYETIGNPFNFPASGTPDTNATSQFVSFQEVGNTGDTFQSDVNSVVASYANPFNTPYVYNNVTYVGDPFVAWSIGNEPIDGHYEDRPQKNGYVTTDDIRDFIRLKMQPGYQGVHNALANSSIQPMVLGPNGPGAAVNLSSKDPAGNYKPNWLSWMEDFFQLSGAKYTDGIGIHTYTGNERSWEEQGIAEVIQYLEWLRDHTPALSDGNLYSLGKPIWITEHGWEWQWNDDMPRLQAAYIVRRYALAASLGIPHDHDFYFKPAVGEFPQASYYLWDGTPTRGGMAMRILGEMTQGLCAYDGYSNRAADDYVNNSHDLLRNLPNAPYLHTHAIAYTDPNANNTSSKPPVIVVWGDDFTDSELTNSPVTLTFTVPNADVHVYDIMGNDMNILPDPMKAVPTYYIPATSSPVYVKMSASDYRSNGLQVLKISGWPLLAGEKNYALSGTASAYAYDSNGVQHPDSPAGALNDGSWHYDDLTTVTATAYDRRLQKTRNYVSWVSNTVAGAAPASSSSPIYPVYAQVTLPRPSAQQGTLIDTIVAVGPSANQHLPGVRDYDLQVQELRPDETTIWRTVKSVRKNTTEWTLAARFDAINAVAVRIVVYDVNNGNWYEDKTPLPFGNGFFFNSSNRATLYELEAWGPHN